MARPKDGRDSVTVNIKLVLRVGRDDDLINLLSHAENKAMIVRKALRGSNVAQLGQGISESDDEFLDEFDDAVF